MGFVTRSRNTRNKVDGAKELKKLVYFSSIVVSPLLEDLKVPPNPYSTFNHARHCSVGCTMM